MSHVASIEFAITDMEAFKRAIAAMPGLQFQPNQTTYRWYGQHVGDYPLPKGFTEKDLGKCEHAVRLEGAPGAYEIGVARNPSGPGHRLLLDFWGPGQAVADVVGEQCEKLIQGYQEEVAMSEMAHLQELGLTEFSREVQPDGSVQLVFETA